MLRQVFLSRNNSSNLEWSLNIHVYQQLTPSLFAPNFDLFPSRLNAKTPKFVSWHPEPGAMAVDAFKMSWSILSAMLFHLLVYFLEC